MKNFYLEWRDPIVTLIMLLAIAFFIKKIFVEDYTYNRCIEVVLERGTISDAETMCKHLRIDYEKVYF